MTHHEWQAALLMPVTVGEARSMAKKEAAVVEEDRRVHVADLFCGRCRGRWGKVPSQCHPVDLISDEAIKRARDLERLREWHRRKAEKKREADRV